ncbi:HAD-IB family hydrolase [Actinokineospora sp. NBRC 105648]|uniref:HAD family hydrolase n=1 Tax=Actinokineospora sp. NBRC 105648 TaxID=3032206 RepID=UPI00249FD27C|nr:HAD-IB family hydrolase [Actinokineospora sp. NBRC 105648]GLZ39222.1 hypothetical protein Acsp05_28460 [Actinokineospora sp. NBRC 105648]
MAAQAAFFDVDETLITVSSAVDFLDYRMGRSRDPRTSAWRLLAPAARLERTAANRAYFALYAGVSVADATAQGRAWFAELAAAGGLFHPPVLAELRAHAERGTRVVLVSGSFAPCLDPIAEAVGADTVLCTEPEAVCGVYTGATARSMIGPTKVLAVRAYLRAHGISAADCHAYGDHASDLPLLSEVGTPVVVGADPVLTLLARRRGWRTVPGTAPYRETVSRFLTTAGVPSL